MLDEPTAVLTAQEVQRAHRRAQPPQAGRDRDRVHQPQARRGARGRRSDHGAAAWQEGRHRPAPGRDRAEPRAPGRRPRRDALGREDPRPSPRARCSRSRICTCATTASSRRSPGSRSRSARVRSSRSPASTATASRSWSTRSPGMRAPESGAVAIDGHGHRRQGRARGDGGRRRPHRRGPPAPRARAPVHAGREPRAARVPPPGAQRARLAAPQLHEGTGRAAAAASSTCAAADRRRTPRRCRAATSRRSRSRARSRRTRSCWSRTSRPAGSTSARSSSCTAG